MNSIERLVADAARIARHFVDVPKDQALPDSPAFAPFVAVIYFLGRQHIG
jgi:hypothetical protein